MTCTEVNHYLDQWRRYQLASLPEAVRKHIESCTSCRALWEFLTRTEVSRQMSEETRAHIERSISDSLRPVSPLPSTGRLTLAFLLIFGSLSAAFIALMGLRGVLGLGSTQFAGMLGVIGAVVFLLALSLSREMVPGEKKVLSPALLFLLVLVSLFLAVVVLFPWVVGRNFLPQGWHCFQIGFLLSVPSAGLIVWLLRRGAVLSLAVTGATAGLLAGLVGVSVLHFGCNVHTAPHIALSHLGVALLGGVLGYVVGHYLSVFWPPIRSGLPES